MARLDQPESSDRGKLREGLKDRVRGLGRDGKFRRGSDQVTDPDDPTKNAQIDHIFTVGFPWGTPEEEEAIPQVKQMARDQFGRTIRFARVFRHDTPEHKANGEFLVTAWIIDLIDRTKPEPPIGEGTKK
jgi:hypothetical protein